MNIQDLRIPIKGRQKTLKNIKKTLKKASSDYEVFYSDEVDVHLNPKIGLTYIRKGHQPIVLTPGKNQKRYLAGAVNSRTGKVVYSESTNKNSELFID